MRILIIEDNEQFALMVCAALNEEGFETARAASGKEGIKTALAYMPDLILLDYELGDMSGYDVAIGLRCMRATLSIPFILLSSLAGDPLLADGFNKFTNCRAKIMKTIPLPQIVATVRQLLS